MKASSGATMEEKGKQKVRVGLALVTSFGRMSKTGGWKIGVVCGWNFE